MSQYTKEQQAVIEHDGGHAIINSVPGSGKTHSLVGRVKHLVDGGVSHRKILVVMYNKAAEVDFFRRMKHAIGSNTLPTVRTFHAMAHRMLKRLMALEVTENYRLETNKSFQDRLCRQTLQALDRDDGNSEVDALLEIVQWIKARDDIKPIYKGKTTGVELDLFKKFEQLRHEAKVRFFDDLLFDLLHTIRANPEVKTLFENRVEHIIIDEYQDINACQQALMKIIAGTRAKVMVCGDVNQTIYQFRGSDPQFMLGKFADDFTDPAHYHLSHTFRFGTKLSSLSNNLIAHNAQKTDVPCVSDTGTHDTSIMFAQGTEYDPCKLVKGVVQKGASYHDIAFLVREFSHAIDTEIAFLRGHIPYQIQGSKGILDNPAIRSIFGYLSLADGAKHFLASDTDVRETVIKDMLTIPALYIKSNVRSRLVRRLAESPTGVNAFLEVEHLLEEKQKKHLLRRDAIWDFCLEISLNDNAHLILKDLYHQLGYESFFKFSCIKKEDAEYKTKLVRAMVDYAKSVQQQYLSVGDFLAHIESLKAEHQAKNQGAAKAQECVLITSMHRAKGLQWDYVILPELTHEKMPPVNDDGEIEDIESERRILYVAMTRARKQLILSGGNDLEKIKTLATKKLIPKRPQSSAFLYECFKAEKTEKTKKGKSHDK